MAFSLDKKDDHEVKLYFHSNSFEKIDLFGSLKGHFFISVLKACY